MRCMTCASAPSCTEVQKNTSITTKAWRHLSWTFEDTPRLAAGAAREHLNGTLFEEELTFDQTELKQEEPPDETDLILHFDDDDAEDPESTGTAVAEAAAPFSSVASQVERAERCLYLRCAYGKHPPKPLSPSVFTPVRDRMSGASCRCCARVRPHASGHDAGGQQQFFKCSAAEQLDMGCVILKDRVFRIPLARLSRFVRTRATLMQYSRKF